ncbi:MAG: tetratricopeptide repeat protein [Myxococcales bacterium]|nr:tetratricopeptide repeat protein [Myxococcales bacterium]
MEAPLEASPPAPAAEGPLESSPPAPEADTPLEEPPPSVLDLVASIAESPPSAPSPPAVADLKPPPPPPGAIASERGDAAHRSSTPASGPVTPPPPPSAAVAGQDTIATVATSPPALPQHDVRPSAPSTTDETPSPAPEDEESTSAADAEQRTALWKRVEECQQSGDLSGVVDALQRLLPLVSDPQKRWKIHANLGDIALHKMDDTPAAARHFQDALKIRPRSKATLLSLLEIYTKTRNFRGAVDVMRPLCDLESDPRKLALYFTTLGTIYVEELGQWDDAVIVYNRALDLNPTTHKTFERIEKILTRRKAWLRMEENYRAHLARIEGDASQEELHQHILRALGKLYMNELERLEEALVIYQRLRTMRPDDSGIQETICEIYDGMADYNPGVLDQLITENRRLLQMLPGNVAGYKTLADAFIRNAMYDQAFSVCSVLVAKRFADSQEEGFFLKHRGGVPRFASALRGSQYASFLYPERLRGALTQILELVASQLPDSIFPAPPRKKAKRKKRVERGDNMVIDIAMRTVLSNFDVDLPELYIDEDVGSLVALPTRPPCLLISPEWLIDRPLPQLAFALGIQAVHFLPQFSLVPMGVAQVRDIVHAVIRACAPSVPVDTTDEIESLREIFANMPEHKLLWSYTQTLLSAGRELEIEEWFNDVERLAYRVGLLLCNDFEAAMTTIHEAHFERRLPPQELEEELSLFAISDAYAKLRRELGVAI